jgi:predicted house-cleaning noncanonical NTP pyrophosphatase (MazG superfamily)
MNYTKEKIIEDIKEYLKDNHMEESDIYTTDKN